MKKNKKNGISPIALILIITTSIVAAVGIILLVLKFIQKKREEKAIETCGCCDCDELDPWGFDDEDLIGDLAFDDEEEYCACEDCSDCTECEDQLPDEIASAVDEAIDAIGAISEDMENGDE